MRIKKDYKKQMELIDKNPRLELDQSRITNKRRTNTKTMKMRKILLITITS